MYKYSRAPLARPRHCSPAAARLLPRKCGPRGVQCPELEKSIQPLSCMGHPLGAALGARLGSGRPTLCVAGDAAFLSQGTRAACRGRAKRHPVRVGDSFQRRPWALWASWSHRFVRYSEGHSLFLGPVRGASARNPYMLCSGSGNARQPSTPVPQSRRPSRAQAPSSLSSAP